MKILRDIEQRTRENQIKGTTQLTDLQELVTLLMKSFKNKSRTGERKSGR